jgi:hypothetical protein
MILHNFTCQNCGDMVQLADTCTEDEYAYMSAKEKASMVPTVPVGISLDAVFTPIKSYEMFRKRQLKNKNYTFCNKACLINFLTTNIEDSFTIKE